MVGGGVEGVRERVAVVEAGLEVVARDWLKGLDARVGPCRDVDV